MIFWVFKINPFPRLPPYSWWFIWRYMIKNIKISKIWCAVFCLGQKTHFLGQSPEIIVVTRNAWYWLTFLPSFEHFWVNHDEKGPSLHDGGLRLLNLLIFLPYRWVFDAQNQGSVNHSLKSSIKLRALMILCAILCLKYHFLIDISLRYSLVF